MNKNNMMDIMGDFDPEFVKEARPRERKRLFLRIGVLILAALIIAAAAIALPKLRGCADRKVPVTETVKTASFLLFAEGEGAIMLAMERGMPKRPSDICVSGGELFILNSAANNILRFGIDGEYRGTIRIGEFFDRESWPDRLIVGGSKLYVLDLYGWVKVFDRATGELGKKSLLPLKAIGDSKDEYESVFYGDGRVIGAYERDGLLICVIAGPTGSVSSYAYDPGSGTFTEQDAYGFSGMWLGFGRLRSNETKKAWNVDLDEWRAEKLLGVRDDGALMICAYTKAEEEPYPRMAFAIAPNGRVVSRTEKLEPGDFYAMCMGDDGHVYALVQDGSEFRLLDLTAVPE